MNNMAKLFLVALALYVASCLCFSSDNAVLIAIGLLLGLVGMMVSLIWLFLILRIILSVQGSNQRRCPSCGSRHYIVYPRGSKFGFAFPARFVKVTKTDLHCQDCGRNWSITETDERDADP